MASLRILIGLLNLILLIVQEVTLGTGLTVCGDSLMRTGSAYGSTS